MVVFLKSVGVQIYVFLLSTSSFPSVLLPLALTDTDTIARHTFLDLDTAVTHINGARL